MLNIADFLVLGSTQKDDISEGSVCLIFITRILFWGTRGSQPVAKRDSTAAGNGELCSCYASDERRSHGSWKAICVEEERVWKSDSRCKRVDSETC